MAGRLRCVDFSDTHAEAMLKQCFPEDADTIKRILIRQLAYEKACPRIEGSRYFWEYEFKGIKIAVYFIMEVPADPYSKIQVKDIQRL